MAKGRPEGSKTIKETSTVELSRCKICNSTDRTPYTNPTELEFPGFDPAGLPFTHIVWRATSCKNCGQARRDKSYENRAPD